MRTMTLTLAADIIDHLSTIVSLVIKIDTCREHSEQTRPRSLSGIEAVV